jgi:hypothetical protein
MGVEWPSLNSILHALISSPGLSKIKTQKKSDVGTCEKY